MGKSRILSAISNFQSLITQGTLPSYRVPLVFREPGVLTGYRPCGKSWGYYFLSVFRFHNESINIWTHGIGALFLIYKLSVLVHVYNTSGDDVFWIMSVLCFCALINFSLSSFAHTFHSKSVFMHYLCYQGDYAGIALLGFGKSVTFFHASSTEYFYEAAKRVSLPVFILLTLVGMTCNCMAKLLYRRPYPPQRKLIQLCGGLIQALVGGIPILTKFYNCLFNSECAMASLNHHSMYIVTMITSLFFFSSHLPEKKYPGVFDFIGQGHQIFHVLLSATLVLELEAVLHDARLGVVRPFDKQNIGIALIVTVIGCGLVMIGVLKITKQRVERDKKDK